MFRRIFYAISAVLFIAIFATAQFWPAAYWALVVVVPLFCIGMKDSLQRRRTLLRNYPIIGRGRYLLEEFRPEIQQYFVETNTEGKPFSREFRSIAYQRAKGQQQNHPFGNQRDVYKAGYEWMNHSMAPIHHTEEVRVMIGGADCKQPYSASHLNVSAMSYGSLSSNAISALNGGAEKGNFFHNTGEGGISPFHLKYGGDLCWQIGTGYFGCRQKDGNFCPDSFREKSQLPSVKLIEIKLSQGAKPAHGGILPGAKVTKEIAEIRGVPIGETVASPPSHRVFDSPIGLMHFIEKLRDLSGGKPVGFKLCVGQPQDFLSICKAMLKTGITPDFISVDGAEGGTGAAPLEFSNSVGVPLRDGLLFVHNALRGCGLRNKMKIIAAGKIISGFHMVRVLAMGADICNSARGMMFALGCIQARRCHRNDCPVGVATTRKELSVALDVEDKAMRVYRYQKETVTAFMELVGAAGLKSPDEIGPQHIYRRVGQEEVKNYDELHHFLEPNVLINNEAPEWWMKIWRKADSDGFRPVLLKSIRPPAPLPVVSA